MDYASYVMLASACSLLFLRMSMSLVKHDRVKQALRQHHAPRGITAWTRLREMANRPRARLAIGFALTLGAFRAVPVLLAVAQPADGASHSQLGAALSLAAKWGLVMLVIRGARTFLMRAR
jgi:hypothetical protein